MISRILKNRITELEDSLTIANEKISFSEALLESSYLAVWSVDIGFNTIFKNENYIKVMSPINGKRNVIYQKNDKIYTKDTQIFWEENYTKALNGAHVSVEIGKKRNKNEYQWTQVFLNPIYRFNKNAKNPIAVSGVAYDSTEKTVARNLLKESEEKFRTIFESFQDLYFKTDLSGKILLLSPSVSEILGYDIEKLIKKNITDFCILGNNKSNYLLKTLSNNHQIKNFETMIIHKSGKLIPCICNIKVIIIDDKARYIEGVARDITELQQANIKLQESKELAENSLKIKEQFLANMSHEIKTPLNGIMGMLHLLDNNSLNEENKERVQTLKNASRMLLNVLNDLLDLSKIEAGKMNLNESIVNIDKFIESLQSLFEADAVKKNLRLDFNIEKSIPKNIITDEVKLVQVFSNLISNAIKFTPEYGEIKINLILKKISKQKLTLQGEVIDNGIGISKNDFQKIFKSFSQIDSSTSKSYKGTGLGLFITKRLVLLMKGSINVTSIKEKGTKFYFTFQTKKSDKEVQKSISTESKKISTNPKVMVVDDNNINLIIASEILEKAGCRVTKASNGAFAIDNSKQEIYDVIFMDIQMPDMDGVETTKLIKKDGKNTRTPIIAMTAYSMKGAKDVYLSKGMDDYISKPIKPEILIDSVIYWTKNQVEFGYNKTEKTISIPTDNSVNVFNQETIKNLLKYGEIEMINDTINEFNIECEKQYKECKKFIKTKEYEKLLVILHTLKGNSGTLGAEKLSNWAKNMEDELKNKNYHIFEEQVDEFKILHSSFKSVFQNKNLV